MCGCPYDTNSFVCENAFLNQWTTYERWSRNEQKANIVSQIIVLEKWNMSADKITEGKGFVGFGTDSLIQVCYSSFSFLFLFSLFVLSHVSSEECSTSQTEMWISYKWNSALCAIQIDVGISFLKYDLLF